MWVVSRILAILIGLAMVIWGGTKGVTVTAPDQGGHQRSAKVYGNGAIGIGIVVALFGVYSILRGAGVI